MGELALEIIERQLTSIPAPTSKWIDLSIIQLFVIKLFYSRSPLVLFIDTDNNSFLFTIASVYTPSKCSRITKVIPLIIRLP